MRIPLDAHVESSAAVIVRPSLVGKWHLVYLLVADSPISYKHGKSRIAYIGMTYAGFWRVLWSTAERAEQILKKRGVSEFEVYFAHSEKRSGVRTWERLEANLLHRFREFYGELPLCNRRGGGPSAHHEAGTLDEIIQRFDGGAPAPRHQV